MVGNPSQSASGAEPGRGLLERRGREQSCAAAAGPIDFDCYIDDRIDEGVFAVHRDIFRDECLFELEMKYIFESNWVFLCHASQIRQPHGFFTPRASVASRCW